MYIVQDFLHACLLNASAAASSSVAQPLSQDRRVPQLALLSRAQWLLKAPCDVQTCNLGSALPNSLALRITNTCVLNGSPAASQYAGFNQYHQC